MERMLADLAIEPHYWWLIAAVLLGVGEIILPGVFLIWLAAAAAITGLATLGLCLPVAAQFILFAVLALVTTWSRKRWYARNPVTSTDPLLNDRAARLIGREVTVVDPITGGEGRVKVGDSVWPACGPDATTGARVRVTGSEGGRLTVEPVGS